MSINRVNTGGESFKFLTNQSSILHTVDTNKITINGVNVIVDKPKRGDIMCITKDQRVVWIDGLSIEPTQLSKEFEPVGICLVVKGNKAIVRYREMKTLHWLDGDRFELPNLSIMNDGFEHTLRVSLASNSYPDFTYTARKRKGFVDQLNDYFLKNNPNYSAELVELDTDLPAADTSDTKDGDNYRNRIIVNASFEETDDFNWIDIEEIGEGEKVNGKHIKAVSFYYLNNGFTGSSFYGGCCCYAKFYDWNSIEGNDPFDMMTSLNSYITVSLTAFKNNPNCQILRDNYATYNEYLESKMVKFPCGAGGAITEFPCGKENTYKLANCTFLNNRKGEQSPLYLAAEWAASIDVNAPKLGKGNWWLPSIAEMVEIMRDITYGTSFWETKPDIINRVLAKLTSIDNSGWSMLSADSEICTSDMHNTDFVYFYSWGGEIYGYEIFSEGLACPITIYEF